MRIKWLIAALLLCATGAAYYFVGPAPTPSGQLSLSDISAFERMFDDASDRVRIVALLSPT